MDETIVNGEIVEYLIENLIEIIKEHGGAPCIYIYRKPDGTLSHSFVKLNVGVEFVGGHPVPKEANYSQQDGELFRPRLEEVREFLRGFGIGDGDVEQIIDGIPHI